MSPDQLLLTIAVQYSTKSHRAGNRWPEHFLELTLGRQPQIIGSNGWINSQEALKLLLFYLWKPFLCKRCKPDMWGLGGPNSPKLHFQVLFNFLLRDSRVLVLVFNRWDCWICIGHPVRSSELARQEWPPQHDTGCWFGTSVQAKQQQAQWMLLASATEKNPYIFTRIKDWRKSRQERTRDR